MAVMDQAARVTAANVRGAMLAWALRCEGEPSAEIKRVYQAFAGLARRHPEQFPDLHFVPRGGVPYSRHLEDILFRMGVWRLLTVGNPEYRYFRVDTTAARRALDSVTAEERATLDALAEELADLLASVAR